MIRHILSSVVLLFILTITNAQTYKFDFGPGDVKPGYTQVLPDMTYNPDRGFGFDYGTAPQGIDRGGNDALTSDFCTGNGGFYFSVTIPEGTYDVKITMGDIKGESIPYRLFWECEH